MPTVFSKLTSHLARRHLFCAFRFRIPNPISVPMLFSPPPPDPILDPPLCSVVYQSRLIGTCGIDI